MMRDISLECEHGITWLFQNHREVYEPIRPKEIRTEIRDHATLFGDHIALVRDGKKMRLIANHEAGYALGESVRDYFDQNQNFVWCEQVDEGNSLIVVVSQGDVLLDAQIPPAQIDQATISAIANSPEPFEFFLWGDVPILRPDEVDTGVAKMAFSDEVISNFVELEGPIVNELDTNAAYYLQPLEKGLSDAKFGIPKEVLGLAVIVIALVGFFHQNLLDMVTASSKEPAIEYVDAWLDYRTALATPAPHELFAQAFSEWKALSEMPLALPLEMEFSNGTFTAKVEQDLVDERGYSQTLTWAENNGWNVVIQSGEIVMRKPSSIAPRPPAQVIRDHKQQMGRLFDDLQFLMNGRVSVSALATEGQGYRSDVTLDVTEASLVDLVTIEQVLNSSSMILKLLKFEELTHEADFDITLEFALLGY